MSLSDNSNQNAGELPQEHFENAISQSIELEMLLGKELTVFFYDLDGNHELKTCYGDLCKTVNALMDYSRILEMVCEEWNLEGFHRATYEYHANKLREIAGKFQAGIGYDYAAAVEKCRKKREKPTQESDVGDDALTQAFRRSQRKNGKPQPDDTPLPDAREPDISASPWEEDDEL